MHRIRRFSVLCLLIGLFFSTPVRGQGGDRLLLYVPEPESPRSVSVALPRGPASGTVVLDEELDALARSADGRTLAVQHFVPLITAAPVTTLFEIDPEGRFSPLAQIGLEPNELPRDLAFTTDGRLFLLTDWFVHWNPPEAVARLVELDPSSGAALAVHSLAPVRDADGTQRQITALALAPDGLWGVTTRSVHRLEPSTGALSEAAAVRLPGLSRLLSADTDTSGALWLLSDGGIFGTPVSSLHRVDPATGGVREVPLPEVADAKVLAVDRRCEPSPTRRCLQGGRFLVEVDREATDTTPAGPSGVARGAAADSGLFWFFEPSNWELLVKVLDGCDLNERFWVFSAATTTIPHVLRVTDLQTETVWETRHAGGDPAPAITATDAFATCE